ncbi:dihydrolipoamide acetyltransferase family protein [Clostridium magnum]|uniref:Dihydrolipoamide acetyltransferase component of pyruvate dehydrogenase complex n=1 Tax=Clostridium magnum DSM 2767 TaxID=1121326 RepID=A0A162QZT7_9CLOT|nr:dihydrolipoamide acetyltransferase family protein [Clostridium magnum]KZL89207.1 dihydrolipoyllysine-residue acetyltransferase component of pyruvate dehydrogenase complex [Clostridium magnum DSM 2767]SHJ35645.1 pyruvate dehydrogenase E2 component (dihydrolipoamide acetyltransferase) [Clostridium magnum DSM 2767]
MATKVIMPKQGLQMTEGTITRWIIAEGGKVEVDQPLFEMETDKLTIEITAPASGTLLKIVKGEGDVVPITETIAVIGEPGEDYSSLLGDAVQANIEPAEALKEEAQKSATAEVTVSDKVINRDPSERVFITPRAKTTAAEKEIDYLEIYGTGPEGLIIERDILAYIEEAAKNKIRISPVAAKIAKENNIDLSLVTGTGVSGRVMKEDVEKFLEAKATEVVNTTEESLPSAKTSGRKGTIVPCKGMRKVISDRMMESLHGMAQANHRMKVDMTEAIKLREQLKKAGIKVSFNDILTKVVSKALIEFPYMNSSMVEEGILLKDYVNMGLAVSVPNGLIVPNIKDADLMSLPEIAAASADIIQKALNGKLGPDEYTNGTFTISNLGMFDIDVFTAIINPPESGILAVGKIEKTPVVEGDNIVIKPLLTLSLTYDHRTIDGALAAQFLQRIKQLLMNPYLLL